MTNLMLSILGVLLAVISTAIAVNYGGFYYEEVREEAELAAAYNAIEQTKIAMDSFQAIYLRPAVNIEELVNANMMNEMPHLNSMRFKETWSSYRYNNVWTKAIVVLDVPLAACEIHNEKVGFVNEANGKPADVYQPSGCYTGNDESETGILYTLIDRY
tara:strand:+ start:446 stop:922 length:477 start_codon:yes stop_codon:yes gene_type:complete